MYSSSGELHLELLTGQSEGAKALWVSTLIILPMHYLQYNSSLLNGNVVFMVEPPPLTLALCGLLVALSFLTIRTMRFPLCSFCEGFGQTLLSGFSFYSVQQASSVSNCWRLVVMHVAVCGWVHKPETN